LARIDPQLLAPVQHRSAQAQAHLMVIRARAGLDTFAPRTTSERVSVLHSGHA
jgi:hypothetical protein